MKLIPTESTLHEPVCEVSCSQIICDNCAFVPVLVRAKLLTFRYINLVKTGPILGVAVGDSK